MISIKSKKEIEIIREGGKIAARILKILAKNAKAGVKAKDLDKIARQEIKKAKVKPSFLGHAGYPATICVSIDDGVVHGIPTDRKFKEGDIVGLDLGVEYRGYHSDTAITVGVGRISKEKKRLLEITEKSLYEGLSLVKDGVYLGDVQNKIQKTIEKAGYSVIRDLAGHGIGKNLQEPPSIPNFGKPGTGPILKEGMVLAIEPMVAEGDWHVKILDDGWTVVMADGSASAHFEHTIAVKKDGYEILT